MSSQPWALPRAKARERARKRPPKRPWLKPVAPPWLDLLVAAACFAWYVKAVRDGDWFSLLVQALCTLFWAWELWLWWRWRSWCRFSGEPFPRFSRVDRCVQAWLLGMVLWTAVKFL